MISKEGLQLLSSSIVYRPYYIDGADWLYEAARASINEVSQWLLWCHPDYSVEEGQAWVESRSETWDEGVACDFIISDTSNGLYL